MIADGLRVTIPEVDPALRALADKRDDSMRLAYFDQSRRTVAGKAAEFRSPQYTHNTRQTNEYIDTDSWPFRQR